MDDCFDWEEDQPLLVGDLEPNAGCDRCDRCDQWRQRDAQIPRWQESESLEAFEAFEALLFPFPISTLERDWQDFLEELIRDGRRHVKFDFKDHP